MKLTSVDTSVINGIAESIVHLGGDPARVLTHVLPPRLAKRVVGTEMALDYLFGLLNEAAVETMAPYFGLHYGARYRWKDLGLIAYLFSYSDCLADSLNGFKSYFPTLQTNSHYEFLFRDGMAIIEYTAPGDDPQWKAQDAEFSFMVQVRLAQLSLGNQWTPKHIEFQHKPLGSDDDYARYLNCECLFERPVNRIVFPAHLSFAANPNADPAILTMIQRGLAEAGERGQKALSATQLVRETIADRLVLHQATTLADIAATFCTTPRKVSTLLERESGSFRNLVNLERLSRAKFLLARPDLNISQVSEQLGYAETAAFTRAFRKQTGQSPSGFRITGSSSV